MNVRIAFAGAVVCAAVVGVFAVAPHQDADAAMLPDGAVAPVIYSAAVAPPARHNDLLEADLFVEAWDADGIESFEYRFNRATIGSVRSTPADRPTIDYRSILPDTRYVIEVRAVDTRGWESDWVVAADAVTPSVPNLVVAGDSVASGYSRHWFSSKGICVNPDASYGWIVQRDLASRLPAAWAPTYTNVAWAGAGVHAMVNGGTDSCGQEHPSQVDSILGAVDASTWNIVVTTAAINSTNWGDVVTKLTKETTFSFSDAGDRGWCETGISSWWNIEEKSSAIAARVAQISRTLTERSNADLYWTSYYTVTGSNLIRGLVPIPGECSSTMERALGLLHDTIKDGLTDTAVWVDIDEHPVGIQDWGGWPHPDIAGHTIIGHAVAAAVR